MYAFHFGEVVGRYPELIYGTLGTLGLAAAGIVLSLTIGITGAVLRTTPSALLQIATKVFVEAIRNTPFLVQLFYLFFALPFVGVRLNPTVTAVLALGINGGAYSIEIIRGGVESIPRGQKEAGFALGLSPLDVFRFIVLRPALRAIYPALTSQFILLTLTSSVCASISAFELTQVGQKIESDTFASFEVYFTITGIYLVLSWLLMTVFSLVGRRAFAYPSA